MSIPDTTCRKLVDGRLYEIVPGTDDGKLLYRVFCLDELERRIRNGDVYAHCKAPDRAVFASFSLDCQNDVLWEQRAQQAFGRLRRKLEPYFSRQQHLTIWDLYVQHCDAFFREHARDWSDATQAQYRSMFVRHIQPVYRLYSLPFSPDTFLTFRQTFAQIKGLKAATYNNIVDKSTAFIRYLERHG